MQFLLKMDSREAWDSRNALNLHFEIIPMFWDVLCGYFCLFLFALFLSFQFVSFLLTYTQTGCGQFTNLSDFIPNIYFSLFILKLLYSISPWTEWVMLHTLNNFWLLVTTFEPSYNTQSMRYYYLSRAKIWLFEPHTEWQIRKIFVITFCVPKLWNLPIYHLVGAHYVFGIRNL